MKIGIISDTHDHGTNLKRAVRILYDEKVELLVHCGDITQPETALLMVEFRLICVFGNLDAASGQIRQTLLSYDAKNYAGEQFTGEIDGIPVAVAHGNRPGSIEQFARSGKYQYVFTGHTHQARHEQINRTWVVNPGALGGRQVESRSFCWLDVASGEIKFIKLD